MKKRKQINYEDIVETGISLIKEETDLLYGESEKNKAESAMRICGIVDFLTALDEATTVTEDTESESEVIQNTKLNEDELEDKLNKFNDFLEKATCEILPLSEKELVDFLNGAFKRD